ncbi:hypothetical protein [Ilyobacter polytropus]|uniref:Uncharacterized protein n=1 Tax=Ilyobacter polytropus (strain ATCC 51220 / DSM 2926 / LMG 16218 / CuHBu1) TaxID=572544 RepID=E3HBD5_ILYPC|nr:hypothetical protein [Ilyobacter polytropus]ADO83750.1 hypothetical protein Ilyop_1979 [Ilyobacter polytropus DSM 2926]
MKGVNFKSLPEFFIKEKSGIKNNTVRKDDGGDRFEKLKEIDLSQEILFLRITNSETGEYFERIIRDVSVYGKLFILTW